jgi:inhibitor of KinA
LKPLFKIFPLGDSAITLDLGNEISRELNRKALAIQQHFIKNPFAGLKDCWVAYSSVTLVYDPLEVKKEYNPEKTVYSLLSTWLQNAYEQAADLIPINGRKIRIPVCYDGEYAMDLHLLAREKQLAPETIIDLHTSRSYRVYMIGFLPGFSYMAEVDERLIIPRKSQPVTVMAGSVGITGSQTGIYPVQCPGGWFIIGRTPYQLFNRHDESPALLQAGDEVEFYRISREEFEAIKKS